PGSLIAADLNADGSLDLATESDLGVSVLLNEGDGTFLDAVSYPVGGPIASLITADLNQDGSPDLATTSGAGLSVLLNQGDGTFQAAVVLGGRLGGTRDSLIAADLNQDGKPDLAIVSHVGVVSALLNQGDGTFPGAVSYAVGGNLLIAADLNQDGSPDLATAQRDVLTVLLNQRKPAFSLDVNRNAVPDECETQFHRGDPNSSGTTDISDGLAIFGYLFLGSESPRCLESADVNNDGAIDLSDGIAILNWLFTGGLEPAAPGPPSAPCGPDSDIPGSAGDLGCETYSACP
ncbi:MAG: VCBS repeat-containing protein, partial [Planctomycetes bacterium]|nr:VCBS repeat-containing protein [Planctomycetota bacterium]